MTSSLVARAWAQSRSTGDARLLLVLMADHADINGVVNLTGPEMRKMANQSSETFARALGDLLTSGEVSTAEKGSKVLRVTLGEGSDLTGSEAKTHTRPYPTIAPVLEHEEEPEHPITVSEGRPPNLVGYYLEAAGVPIDMEKPFYWFQREHRHDADELTRRGGGDIEHVAACLRRASIPGDPKIRRLIQLGTFVSRPARPGR